VASRTDGDPNDSLDERVDGELDGDFLHVDLAGRTLADRVFVGAGEMTARLRGLDWSATSLGALSQWPERLVQTVRLVLPSPMPMMLWWGEKLVQIYNDAYGQLLGNKHPSALGQPASECWAEVWDDLAPFAQRVMRDGESTLSERQLLFVDRHGYLEETYWTFCFSPVRDDGDAVLGMLVTSNDVTSIVVGQRRLETVRQLGALSSSRSAGLEQTCKAAIGTLAANSQAVPFAAMHIIEDGGTRARFAAGYGIETGASFNPAEEFILAAAPEIEQAVSSGSRLLVTGLRESRNAPYLGHGPLGEAIPDAAMILPIAINTRDGAVAVATLGVNPYRAVDDVYLAFFQLVARQLRVSVGDALALESERLRAEMGESALSEAEDRADNLHHALDSNRQIGVAMGVIMTRQGVTEQAAFDLLREASQHSNRKLRDVADEVVLTGELAEHLRG
jgi:hypothetical protein